MQKTPFRATEINRMLENLTAIPLANVGGHSTDFATEKQNQSTESELTNKFKSLLNNDLNKDFELKKPAQLDKSGSSQTALQDMDFSHLGDKLQAYIAQLEDGSTVPASGNKLPVLPPEVGQLLREIEQNWQALRLEQGNDFSVETLPAELKSLLSRLAAIAEQLNALVGEFAVDDMSVGSAPLIVETAQLVDQPVVALNLLQDSGTKTEENSERVAADLLLGQSVDNAAPDKDALQQQLTTLKDFLQSIQALVPDRASHSVAELVLEPKGAALASVTHTALLPKNELPTNDVQKLSAQGALLESAVVRLEQVLNRFESVLTQRQNGVEDLMPTLANIMPSNSQAGRVKEGMQHNTALFPLNSTVQNSGSVEAFSPQLLALTTAAQNPIQPLGSPITELTAQLTANAQDVGFNLATAVNQTGTAQASSTFMMPSVQLAAQPTATSVAQPFATQIGLPMNNTQWGDQFVQRVVWLAGQGIASAEIQLNPAELGPLHVRIDSHEDSARVVFTAHNVSARDSIENNLPRLRELFASQGLDLLDVDVESQQNKHGDDEGVGHEGSQQPMADEGDLAVDSLSLVSGADNAYDNPLVKSLVLNYGRVDAFA